MLGIICLSFIITRLYLAQLSELSPGWRSPELALSLSSPSLEMPRRTLETWYGYKMKANCNIYCDDKLVHLLEEKIDGGEVCFLHSTEM